MIDWVPGTKWTGKEITTVERLAVLLRGHFTCAYCGVDLTRLASRDVTMDHLVSRHHGGKNEPGNLVPACRSCNSSKREREWRDYAPGGAQKRILEQVAEPLNIELAVAILRGDIATDEEIDDE